MALRKTFGTATEPYNRLPTMTIKVIAVKETVRVHRWEFSEEGVRPHSMHKNAVAAISDGNSVLKFVLFEELAKEVREGKCYIVKNYGISKLGTQPTMLSKRNTAIYMCAPISISEALEQEGKRLLEPPSPLIKLRDLGAHDHFVTVQGTVISMEEIQIHQEKKGNITPLRCIQIKENEAEVKVVLWREANLTPLAHGLLIQLTHMLGRNSPTYGYSLHSTTMTKVDVAGGQIDVKVKGFRELENGEMEVLDSDDIPRTIPASVWSSTFADPLEGIPENLTLVYDEGKVQKALMKEE